MSIRNATIQLVQKGAIPLLLAIVAGRQLVLTQTVGLSPWHGGGFGMFASIDRDEWRQVEAVATDCEGKTITITLESPSDLFSSRSLIYLRTVPELPLLATVAQALLQAELRPTEQPAVYSAHMASTSNSTCLQQVRLQVWRLRHQRQPSLIWYEPISPLVEARP
ncbi:hypothetical protein IQ241_02720 [Romeria aff. gracilis LEGE 07310]|uniref:Uncharacterized protein n=1 Tax=Vasconcelosia minhoensis LEGE 07310 TaxID=915328 RepID=A0A8J7ATH7_9CYAN|nr:hypothetical protein [Romeria gracilis]MBE9076218.1 hypothetical protein [Romeria aff. gracilis LEGE 07310]